MKNHNPKYAFYYLLSLVALIFTSVSVVMIVFEIIDKSVFDSLAYYGSISNQGSLRFGISALLVSSPIYFICVNLINRGLKSGEIKKDSLLRNWLTYFILAVSAVIILGSVVGIINSFLSGELTLKSVLRLLTIVIVSALVFSFYLYDIKRDEIKDKDRIIKAFFFSSLVVVAIVFVSSWFFVDSPKIARERKIDQKLLNNIYSVESYVNIYYEKKEILPESLNDLSGVIDGGMSEESMIDPRTGDRIDYTKLGDESFQLCANFKTDSYESERNRAYPVYMDDGSKVYVEGQNCFEGNLWAKERLLEKK